MPIYCQILAKTARTVSVTIPEYSSDFEAPEVQKVVLLFVKNVILMYYLAYTCIKPCLNLFT